MARYDNNNRITPDAVQNYDLQPAANVVDKQSKYTPQVGDAERLKYTAQGLSRLAKGITDVNFVLQKQSNENMIEAMSKTEEKNRADWNEVSSNLEGMAKFNPYNKDAYKTLRAKANMEQGVYELAKLEANSKNITFEQFESERQRILNQTVQNMQSEGLKAKHSHGYLTKLQDESFRLKDKYITEEAERDYTKLQNQIVYSTSKDIATLTFNNPNGFAAGWNEAVKNLENVCNSVGMNNAKQAELLYKTTSQYLIDNVDDIDAEEFVLAVGQTTINGQPLSDYDPNYVTNMRQLLKKAKGAKLEMDKMDLEMEKFTLEKNMLHASKDMFNFMSSGDKSPEELQQKAMELINEYGLEAVGGTFLAKLATDRNTFRTLQTAVTNPETHQALVHKYLTQTLTQDDIITALENNELSIQDATTLYNQLSTKNAHYFSEELRGFKETYLDTNASVALSGEVKKETEKAAYAILNDNNLTDEGKRKALAELREITAYRAEQEAFNKSKNPYKLITKSYMDSQKAHTQDIKEAQRYVARMGFLRNQIGTTDTNVKVSSAMQAERTVYLANGTKQTEAHKGTDVVTTLNRELYAPSNCDVVASGYEETMGYYLLLKDDKNRYIKLLHLAQPNLPKAGTKVSAGQHIGYVGATGNVTTKDKGILHIEFFDKNMKLVDPKQFTEGR